MSVFGSIKPTVSATGHSFIYDLDRRWTFSSLHSICAKLNEINDK